MVAVPVLQSQARLRTGGASERINPGAARGIAVDYSGAGDSLIRAGLQMAERAAALEEKKARARDAVEAVKATTAATRTLNDSAYEIERDGDFKTGEQRFDHLVDGPHRTLRFAHVASSTPASPAAAPTGEPGDELCVPSSSSSSASCASAGSSRIMASSSRRA